MWRVNPPHCTAIEAYSVCISRVKDGALKQRLLQIEGEVVAASDAFAAAVPLTELHTLPTADNVAGIVTAREMEVVYTSRMAKLGAAGRDIYDELRSAANGRCPLCGHRQVTTLDHHLPKSLFPALSVAPLNLVPSCTDCNKTKIDIVPHTSAEETIHPYFDDFEDDPWLYGSVLETAPAAVHFTVNPPAHWDDVLAERVRRQFRILELSKLYATQAAEELLHIRAYLKGLLVSGGANMVKAHLEERADSSEVARVNSWQTSTYRAFASSDWFCTGGFALEG